MKSITASPVESFYTPERPSRVAIVRPAIVSFVALTLITGVAYPALVTGLAQLIFADKANGSILIRDGQRVGSSLIGQNFTGPGYFWPRPSAAGSAGYDAASGSGTNLGPSNPALQEAVATRVRALREAHPERAGTPVPIDLVTASGSGLDPHISPASVEYQLARVARARGVSEADVRRLATAHTAGRTFGVLGEPRVNALRLNLALDELRTGTAPGPRAQSPLGWRWRGFVAGAK
jgi:K+-transporting ATPase ATPase C chain